MINEKSNVNIQGWMLKLGLSLGELMVYATIYSFTNGTSDHCFRGSAGYLSEWCLMTKRGVFKVLKKLEERGLIQRKERNINGVKFIDYYTDYGDATKVTGDELSSSGGDEYSSSHNIEIDNNSNNTIISSPGKKLAPQDEQINLSGPVADFVTDSYEKFPSVRYQMNKNPDKYFLSTINDLDKLKKEYGEETVYTVLKFIKQDPFWSKQIQSISKLRKKNKDGVPYMVVMLEKMQQWKPKVLDLDSIAIGLS